MAGIYRRRPSSRRARPWIGTIISAAVASLVFRRRAAPYIRRRVALPRARSLWLGTAPSLVLWKEWHVLGEVDPNDFAGTTTFYFEATFKTNDSTYPVRARLVNATDVNVVADSEVTSTSTTRDLVRSGPITLQNSAKEYRGEFGGQPNTTPFTCYKMRIYFEIT